MTNYSTIEEIRQAYPDKWVLLGDPKTEATNVLGGFVVFSAETKQGLLEGRDLLKNFKRSTWTFTGEKRRGTRQWFTNLKKLTLCLAKQESIKIGGIFF